MRKLLYVALCLTLLFTQGCRKKPPTAPPRDKSVRISKIIDWEAVDSVAGTTPEYTVEYAGDKIVALHGTSNDSIRFEFEQNASRFPDSLNIPNGSRIIRRDNLLAFQGSTAVDTFYFSNSEYSEFRSLALGDSSYAFGSMYIQFLGIAESAPSNHTYTGSSENAGFTSSISVGYDSDGDITSINKTAIYGGFPLTFNVEVRYSNHRNNLNAISPDLSLYDPSCRGAAAYTMIAPDQHVNVFPFSIHYGTKCVAGYKIESNYTAQSDNTVSYNFDEAGDITKIFINGKPFKEFVYVLTDNL